MKLSEIAERLELACEGDGGTEITGLAGLRDAGERDLSFVEGASHLPALTRSRAGAVIAPLGLDVGRPCLRSETPYVEFARVIALIRPASEPAPGVHPSAVVDPSAQLGEGVSVGAFAVIGAGARIGARTRIYPHVTVYPGVAIGRDCQIHSGAHLRERVVLGERVVVQSGAVIGSEGFGFALRSDGSRVRVPHCSAVVIGDDAEVGANTTIDASHPGHRHHDAHGSATYIGPGVKIDNLVQIGHGCSVGEQSTLCAQAGLAGSTHLGRRVFFGGQSGSKGHIEIGDGSLIGGATAVTGDVTPGSQILGVPPGTDRRSWGRIVAAWKRLPELLQRVRRLERRLEEPGRER